MGDHRLPQAQQSPSYEDEVFMDEVEQIPSHYEESLMDPQTLVKEAKHKAGILNEVGRFSESTSSLLYPVGRELGPVGKNMLLESYQPGPNLVWLGAELSKKVGNLTLI